MYIKINFDMNLHYTPRKNARCALYFGLLLVSGSDERIAPPLKIQNKKQLKQNKSNKINGLCVS